MGEQKALVSIVYFKDLKGATEQYASFFTSQITISISARLSQNDAHKSDFYQPNAALFQENYLEIGKSNNRNSVRFLIEAITPQRERGHRFSLFGQSLAFYSNNIYQISELQKCLLIITYLSFLICD